MEPGSDLNGELLNNGTMASTSVNTPPMAKTTNDAQQERGAVGELGATLGQG
jgi:hypothetical protein